MTDGDNLKTDYITLTKLTPHPRNVRQGDVGAISLSLTEHGQYRPIIVQRSTGHIIAGNHTYKAAKALGWKQLAVNYLDVTDEQALRILLVDNRTNDLATYDDNALADLLTMLAATEQTLAGTGYDKDDLDELLGTITNQPITNGNPDDMELDPHYCDVICARYQRITNTEPINATTGEPHNFLTDETISHGN